MGETSRVPIKVEADALEIGLAAGIFTKADVIAWSDRWISESERPPGCLLEIATAQNLDLSAFAQLLASFPGESDPDLTKRLLLAVLRSRLARENGRLRPVVCSLVHLESRLPFPREEESAVSLLDDGVDLAEWGISGTVEEVRQQAEQFRDAYSAPAETLIE